MSRRPRLISWVVAGPAVLLVGLEALVLAATLVTGQNPRAPIVSLNLAEAAAVRDGAEMVRLLERGDDPNERYAVRAGLLEDRAVVATPLEAALSIRRAELVMLLHDYGARTDAATWGRLACVARGEEFEEVLEALAAYQPPGATAPCTGDERLFPPFE